MVANGDFFDSASTASIGGSLTEDEFWAAAERVAEYGRRGSPLITSIGTVRRARYAAERAFILASDRLDQRDQTPRWRWRKRRRLARESLANFDFAESMWATFGELEQT